MRLADVHTVVAPDLIGHGDSATPRGDYSLGAHAASIRDLLTGIGIDKATIVGHSLGGGVAMQFFYQFPQRTERLALVSSGGLGREVSPLLRTAALPGVSPLLSLAAHDRAVRPRGRQHVAARPRVAAGQAPAGDRTRLGTPEGARAREAFLQTLRAVIDVRGQRVSARDRLYPRLDAYPGRGSGTGPSRSRTGWPPTKPFQAAASRCFRGPPTSPTSRTPRASRTCCATSSPRPSPST